MINSFQKRKKDVLSKLDKSCIGKWDEKIIPLCDKINSLENYYTTSSCSGRIILIVDQEKKGESLFVFVSHDKISFKKLKEELLKIISFPPTPPKRTSSEGKMKLENEAFNKNIKFKVEPCIIHISCEKLEDAEKMQEMGKNSGWKNSGIIGLKNNFTVELNGTERLEFPVIRNKKILVDDEFLKIIVDEANRKLEKSWTRINELEKKL